MSDRTPEQFMAAVRGIPGHHVAAAMTLLTPGIDWVGCPKGHMAKEWAADRSYKRYRLELVKLGQLAAMARARAAGERDWRNATGKAV